MNSTGLVEPAGGKPAAAKNAVLRGNEPQFPDALLYAKATRVLGGDRYWPRPTSRSDVHAIIMNGVPCASLRFLVNGMKALDEADVAKVLGFSPRTLRRHIQAPTKPMSPNLASKVWLFAETLAKASEVFGTQEAAELWMAKNAMGLDGQRPIELLQTLQGAELVNEFLIRLEYGVYC